jgi:hypothetical protein
MSIQHTPGPWWNEQARIRTVAKDETFPAGRKLATVHIGPVGSDEAIANANLIAAAPDLVAALRRLMEAVSAPSSNDPELYWHNVGAAQFEASSAIARTQGARP